MPSTYLMTWYGGKFLIFLALFVQIDLAVELLEDLLCVIQVHLLIPFNRVIFFTESHLFLDEFSIDLVEVCILSCWMNIPPKCYLLCT